MGHVRTKTVKKTSKQMIEKYHSRMTLDFHTNKKVLEEVSILPSKCLRNKVVGFTIHLMRHIQRGPVHSISLKLQEEERVPEKSALEVDEIRVDKETMEILTALDMDDLPDERQPENSNASAFDRPQYGGPSRDRIYASTGCSGCLHLW